MWPNGKRCAVGWRFDVDAETIWLCTMKQPYPGEMSCGEDGTRAGVPRILPLLRQYDIKATFCVPVWTAETYPHLLEVAPAWIQMTARPA